MIDQQETSPGKRLHIPMPLILRLMTCSRYLIEVFLGYVSRAPSKMGTSYLALKAKIEKVNKFKFRANNK